MVAGSAGAHVVIDAKITAQLAIRGWTEQEVRDAVAEGPIGISTDNTDSKSDTATVYGSRQGGYVVVNDVTRRVIQISDRNDPGWVPDSRIVWA